MNSSQGLFFEFAYEIYTFSYEYLIMLDTREKIDVYLGMTGINFGYKFKI